MASARSTCLVGFLEEPRRAEVAAIADLEARLATQLGEASAAWPTVALDPEVYLRFLADKLRERGTEPADHVITSMPASDLYLAAGCAAGEDAAILAFRDEVFPVLRPALRKLKLPDPVIEETEQRVLIMILVPMYQYEGR